MQALWDAGGWVNLAHIHESMNYHRDVAYNTTATVVGILCGKGLICRELGDQDGHCGSRMWWYCAAQPQAEHIGSLIAALLDYSATPGETLTHALARTTTTVRLDGSSRSSLLALRGTDVANGQVALAEQAPAHAARPPGNGVGRLQLHSDSRTEVS